MFRSRNGTMMIWDCLNGDVFIMRRILPWTLIKMWFRVASLKEAAWLREVLTNCESEVIDPLDVMLGFLWGPRRKRGTHVESEPTLMDGGTLKIKNFCLLHPSSITRPEHWHSKVFVRRNNLWKGHVLSCCFFFFSFFWHDTKTTSHIE